MTETKYVIHRNARGDNDELTHWLKKGEQPKYLKKIPIGNGKFKYVYADTKLDSHKPQTVSKPTLTSKVTAKTKQKAKITNNMKTDQIKKQKEDQLNTAIANAKKQNAAKKNELTQKGYKEATSVKNSIKTLLGVDHKSKSGNADVNAGYSVGSSKTAAKAALKKHAKTAVNDAKTKIKNVTNSTLKSASTAINKGKKFLEGTGVTVMTDSKGRKKINVRVNGRVVN